MCRTRQGPSGQHCCVRSTSFDAAGSWPARRGLSLVCRTIRVVVFVAAVAAFAGCDSGGSESSPAPLIFHDGVATLLAPLSARGSPVVAAIGHYVVVFGGRQDEGSAQVRWLDDGAVYDLHMHTWRSMEPAPFSRAPYGTFAATGHDALIVVGTPCGVTDSEMDAAACPGAVTEVAAYRPATNSWSRTRALRFPTEASDIAQRTAQYGSPLNGAARGWMNGGVIVWLEEPQSRVLKVRPDGAVAVVDPSLRSFVPPPNSSSVTVSLDNTKPVSRPVVRVVGLTP